MRTEQLIQAMAADTARSRPPSALLPWALLLGALIAAAGALPLLGVRPDYETALTTARVLVKQTFPVLLAAGAFGAVLRLARPGLSVGRWALVLAAVPAILLVAVAAEMMTMPENGWMPAMIGQTSRQCLLAITLMSVPLLAGALWALSRGASTRPRLSGAIAGLMSGGVATAIYAIHCTEDSPLFYGVWYVLGILIVAAAGAIVGGRALRW